MSRRERRCVLVGWQLLLKRWRHGRPRPVRKAVRSASMVRGKTPRKPLKKAAKAPNPKKVTAKRAGKTALLKGYNPLAPARINDILQRLDGLYPNVTCALHHKSAWELVVATILSAQCTDVRVNMVTPGLFAKYPTPQHFAALEPEDLEPDIRSTGFFRNKSKS